MGKKKGGKKKAGEMTEPPHEGSWEKAVQTGVWELPLASLPDANTWPTWGALRERILMACKEIKIRDTPSLRDAFVAEVVVLSPPDLTLLDLSGSSNLHKVMLSPMTACPKLNEVNLNNCRALDYVLIQSQSATRIDISKCGAVTKVLLHCPNLQTVCLTDCPNLHTVMLWSDQLKELDLTGCTGVHSLKLQCPALESRTIPPLVPPPPMQKPIHPPFSAMLRENLKEAAQAAAQMRESDTRTIKDDSIIPRVYR